MRVVVCLFVFLGVVLGCFSESFIDGDWNTHAENTVNYFWCEEDMSLYTRSGYKVLDYYWLETQLNGGYAQRINARFWIERITNILN